MTRTLALLAVAASVMTAGMVHAQDPAAACAALRSGANTLKFSRIQDAPTSILSAKVIPAGGDASEVERDLPEICRVEGKIAPQTGFLLRLPTKTWNGKFMMGGCGGPCGNYLEDRIDPALVRGYAVVTTDMGHKGTSRDYGYNNLQGQIDFGFRATHTTAAVAKELIAAYYGKKAARNYFWGCSTGGRQAMVSAQRFPEDFDGILGGAPPWNQTANNSYYEYFNGLANLDKDRKPILQADKIPLIHDAVMAACDALDGLKDGILQNPRLCKWDPKEIQCKGANAKNCLTAAEVQVVQQIYRGPRNARGDALYGAEPPGSEDQWVPQWITRDGTPGTFIGGKDLTPDTMLQYSAFWPPPGPTYSITQFDMDRDLPRLALTESIYSAHNPDLRRLKAVGGKLILYHGWHDNNIPADASIDYYETSTRTMGGPENTRDFFRLFLVPAMNHCRGGFGGGEIDWIGALENWVEKGQAPDQVIAYHTREPYPTKSRGPLDSGSAYTRMARHPLAPTEYDRARPVYAYPDYAQYSGQGDPAKPESWQKAPR